MTARKPPGVSYEDWVDRQLREARERGAFDDLPGAGKPLDDAMLRQSAGEWAVDWARREGADLTAALPLALALRRDREQLVAEVPGKPTEQAVRAAVDDFNRRLDAAYRRPQEVPPVALAFVDLERQLTRWRDAHPAPAVVAGGSDGVVPAHAPPAGRRWWQRRRAGEPSAQERPGQ